MLKVRTATCSAGRGLCGASPALWELCWWSAWSQTRAAGWRRAQRPPCWHMLT